jgi:hypothetical protein
LQKSVNVVFACASFNFVSTFCSLALSASTAVPFIFVLAAKAFRAVVLLASFASFSHRFICLHSCFTFLSALIVAHSAVKVEFEVKVFSLVLASTAFALISSAFLVDILPLETRVSSLVGCERCQEGELADLSALHFGGTFIATGIGAVALFADFDGVEGWFWRGV